MLSIKETFERAIAGGDCCQDSSFNFKIKAIKEINPSHRVIQISAEDLAEPMTLLMSYTENEKNAYLCFFEFDQIKSAISTNKFAIIS